MDIKPSLAERLRAYVAGLRNRLAAYEPQTATGFAVFITVETIAAELEALAAEGEEEEG